MSKAAGSFTHVDASLSTVPYRFGALGTEVGAKRGRFMDWSYAAAFDREDTGGVNEFCSPETLTYGLEEDTISFEGTG